MYIYIYICMCMVVCLYMCICACAHVCMKVWLDECVYVHTYVCTCSYVLYVMWCACAEVMRQLKYRVEGWYFHALWIFAWDSDVCCNLKVRGVEVLLWKLILVQMCLASTGRQLLTQERNESTLESECYFDRESNDFCLGARNCRINADMPWAVQGLCNTPQRLNWRLRADFRSGALPGLIWNNFAQKSSFGERLDNLLRRRTCLTNVSKFLLGGCSNKRMFRSLAWWDEISSECLEVVSRCSTCLALFACRKLDLTNVSNICHLLLDR